MQTSILRIATLTSPPITIQDTQVHVRSQLVQLRFPTIRGGVIWNRPVAVVVRALDGEEEIISVPDVTRTALLALAGLCLTAMLVQMFFRRKNARS
jgi:hypothetical protein